MKETYVDIMEEREQLCVKHEFYELASRYRDLARYSKGENTTDPEEMLWRTEYEIDRKNRLIPPDLLDACKNPTLEKIEEMKKKYLYNEHD